MEQICDDFKSKNPYPAGALLPSPAGEMMSKSKEDLKPPPPETLTQLEVKP